MTVEYEDCNGVPVPRRVHTIVISTQHAPEASNEQLRADLMEHVIKSVVPPHYLDQDTVYHLNPSGKFVIGGPHGDAGLTGRKIIIDTYGGKPVGNTPWKGACDGCLAARVLSMKLAPEPFANCVVVVV